MVLLRLFMMTTNLFVIANVKQLRTGGSFRILLPFFPRISLGIGVLNSAIFNIFHNRVEFGTILEDLRNFGGGFEPPQPPLGTPLQTSEHVLPRRLKTQNMTTYRAKISVKTWKFMCQRIILNGTQISLTRLNSFSMG